MASNDADAIIDCGVVAIVRLDSASHLLLVAKAIAEGGISVIEFTMTTPGALDVLRQASHDMGDKVILGAGTVLDTETARAAILAGARFIVSPTLSGGVIELCRRYGIVSIPGAYSPTEMLTAWERGATLVKLFPATSLGPQFIRDVLAPLPQIKVVATGGVTLANAPDFIRAGASAVAVGSSLVDRSTVAAGAFDVLTDRARAFREAVAGARERPADGGRSPVLQPSLAGIEERTPR
jgi:2-dehydro-3-deoxyphosphogluconate aldolase / (4S)-4-hydroxy-2-oxoglutarate aldolase